MKKTVLLLSALSLLTACSSSKIKEQDKTNTTNITEISERVKALDEDIDNTNLELDKILVATSAIEESMVSLKEADALFGDEIGEISSNIKQLKDFYSVKVHFEKSGVVFKSQMDRFTVVMPYDVTFEFNKHELRAKFNDLLSAVAEAINMAPELKVEIVGHTDNIGAFDYNRKLSEKRAQTVADYLISKNVDKNRLVIKGMGFDEPVATNDTENGRALNRRVEINIAN
jgi:outer membrane protein OmpA-like peptidoglycan-associated protein